MRKINLKIKAEIRSSQGNVRVRIIRPPLVNSLELKKVLYYRARAVVI